MTGRRYVWILVGGSKSLVAHDAHNTGCTEAQLNTALEGAFSVFSQDGLTKSRKSKSNLVSCSTGNNLYSSHSGMSSLALKWVRFGLS